MIKRTLLAVTAIAVASVADASTTVSIMEFGKGGTVRRTTKVRSPSSVSGVSSFWSALHSSNRKLQYAGMSVVPDLFNQAESGLFIGLMGNGLDLASMPTVSKLVQQEGNGVIGHFDLNGEKGSALLKRAPVQATATSDLTLIEIKEGIQAFNIDVDESNSEKVDAQVASLVKSLQKEADKAGTTVILHLVVEEEQGAARRKIISRRLDENGGDDSGDESNDNGEEEEGNDDQQTDQQAEYYASGYTNEYGEFITPYKTIFQIQYFNVVLWTSIGLVVILGYSTYLMIRMPLMADTLLFGESAKMMGE